MALPPPHEGVNYSWSTEPFEVKVGDKTIYASGGAGSSTSGSITSGSIPSGSLTSGSFIFASPGVSPATPVVRIRYDTTTEAYQFRFFEPRPNSASTLTSTGAPIVSTTLMIASEQLARAAGASDTYVRTVLSNAVARGDISERAAQMALDQWTRGELEPPIGEGGTTKEIVHEPEERHRFPETARPVLARLKAEVEMCKDELQQSRLQAILDSLMALAPNDPNNPDDPVSSAL